MSDPRDPLGARYRELAREEPPAHLDAAILAASRRAVSARPAAQRWFVPVSVAAVLVLGIGVALRMQVEQPGIETSAPQSEYTMPATPPAESPAVAADSKATPQREETAPSAPATLPAEKRSQEPAPRPAPRTMKKEPAPVTRESASPTTAAPFAADPPAPPPTSLPAPPAPPPTSLPAPAAAPPAALSAPPAAGAMQDAPASAAAPSVTRPARPAATAQPAAPMGGFAPEPPASRPQTTTNARVSPPPASAPLQGLPRVSTQGGIAAQEHASVSPEAELERIARLRETGRDAEADKALAEFHRRFPQHRIPDAMWERVKPR